MISILLPNLRGGGAERVSIDLADALRARGFAVEIVLLCAEGEFMAEAAQRHAVINLGVRRARNAVWRLAKYISHRRPDGLIAAMWPLTVIAPLAVKLSRHQCNCLVVEHNTLSNQYWGWGLAHWLVLRTSLAVGFRMAHACAGVSLGVSEDAAKLAFYSASKVITLANPIPAGSRPSAEALSFAESVWPLGRGKRIISVGSLKEQKNHRMLLRAFKMLGDPAACLLILGRGNLETALRAEAQNLGVAGRVVFAGFYSDPTPFYMSSDLFVLSSDYEGFGNVIVEALSCGIPVVSTDCPSGPAEILDNGRFGILTPVGDAQAMSRALQEAFRRSWDYSMLVRRARDFSPDVAAERYLKALGLK